METTASGGPRRASYETPGTVDLDGLNDAIHRFADRAGPSAGVHERPPGYLTRDIVAVTFTVG